MIIIIETIHYKNSKFRFFLPIYAIYSEGIFKVYKIFS